MNSLKKIMSDKCVCALFGACVSLPSLTACATVIRPDAARGTVSANVPAFREELAREEDYGEIPEHFRLVDGYGLKGNLESLRTTLDLLAGGERLLELRRGSVAGEESYRLDVSDDRVVVTAGDDEGLRRAVYYVFDRVRAGDLASVVRKPWLRNRISRCYFGPIKRAPFFTDELMNDIDYYPKAYLNRLAHEGINGLWLTVAFADIAKTDFFPVSPTRERRLAKLRQTVAKCARYGIKTWLFFIEPKILPKDDPFFRAHPEARGVYPPEEKRVLCSSAPVVRAYLEQATRSIFEAVPGLGGAIAITHGERATSCLSEARPPDAVPRVSCPACAKLQPWEISRNTIGPMVKGMCAANPSAKFISWFYQPQPSPERGAWVAECARHQPEGVVFQYNFESGAEREQLGRVRLGGDYWLSYEGPSRPFRRIAEALRETGKSLSAKIQVGCSHEVATVPYVPAPGLLYRKYRAMREAGVTDVMQCWYFGNYPGTMNAAAGELAFETFEGNERAFLDRLARPDWKGLSDKAAAAWEAMTRGYAEYPLSNQMQYYGPVHAGLTWPLSADIEMKGLPRSWKPQDTPHGDVIGECLENHTVGETVTLFDRALARMRGDGVDPLAALEREIPARDWPRLREVRLMRTLRNQFESARNILEFYRLRAEAVFASREVGDAHRTLDNIGRMRRIVLRERELGRETARFAACDSRLGYHSESEDHRFDADKIRRRTDGLLGTLKRLDEIAAVIRAGGTWPESPREKAAPRWTHCRRDPAGDLLIEGDSPDRETDKGLDVYLYDVCGAAFRKKYAVPVRNGRFSLHVPASDWGNDPVYRPGWIMLDRVDDPWSLENRRWPAEATPTEADLADPRLNLWGVFSDRFGRLVYDCK